jgi:hypothetical protein
MVDHIAIAVHFHPPFSRHGIAPEAVQLGKVYETLTIEFPGEG